MEPQQFNQTPSIFLDPQTYPETIRFLQRLLKKSKFDVKISPEDITGLQPDVLAHLNKNPDITFEIKELDRSDIHSALMDFYMKQKYMPTSRELFAGLVSKTPLYMDIDNFRKLLIKMGYVFKRISRHTPVIMEKPEVTFDRYEYLKKIILFREEGRSIIFIDESAVESSGNYFNVKQSIHFAKRCQNQLQQRYIYGVTDKGIHCLKEITDFNEDNFMEWITDYLLKILSRPTVIVFNNEKHHYSAVKIPTVDTIKVDLMAWLDRYDIPHDPDMAKHELFNIVQKCSIKKAVNTVDEILKANGHTVLRVPDCIKRFTPATTIFQTIKSELENYINELDANGGNCTDAELNDFFKSTMASFTDDQLKECWDFIAEEEILQFQVDLEVDRVIDDLIEDTKLVVCKDESNSQVPSCDESD